MDKSGSAFPSHGSMGEVVQDGMTLRQWYAGMALQGMAYDLGDYVEGSKYDIETRQKIAKECFKHADAMLTAGGGE